MANRFDVSSDFPTAEMAARRVIEMQDAPMPETRPAPNDEHHRTFQLAVRHRELNEEYSRLLDEFAGCMQAFAQVLDIPRGETTVKH